MDKYDIVFLGYPNWWYSVPMAVLGFAESYDFGGKTVIPFCCHGTGGLAGSLRDLRPAFTGETNFVNNAFGVYRPDTLGCRPEVNSWLREGKISDGRISIRNNYQIPETLYTTTCIKGTKEST